MWFLVTKIPKKLCGFLPCLFWSVRFLDATVNFEHMSPYNLAPRSVRVEKFNMKFCFHCMYTTKTYVVRIHSTIILNTRVWYVFIVELSLIGVHPLSCVSFNLIRTSYDKWKWKTRKTKTLYKKLCFVSTRVRKNDLISSTRGSKIA